MMRNEILYQIIDSIPIRGLDTQRLTELVLQLLAWENLSRCNAIAEDLKFSDEFIRSPEKIVNVFQALSASGELMRRAFGHRHPEIDRNPHLLRDAMELVKHLSANGVLENINTLHLDEEMEKWPLNIHQNMPKEVADLLVDIARIGPKDSVYTPWDSTFAQLASRASLKADQVYYESILQSAVPALISILSKREFNVSISDPIAHPTAIEGGRPRLFDVTVTFPPFGMRYSADEVRRDIFRRFPERTQIGSVLAIRHALSQTKSRLVIAVPNSVLFSHGYERELRIDLVEKGMIETVISMPSGLLHQTNIAFSILVMNPGGGIRSIKFINADQPQFYIGVARTKNKLSNLDKLLDLISHNKESEDCVIVPSGKILDNDAQLQVDRYVISESRRQLEKRLSNLNTIQLGDIVRTVRAIPAGLRQEMPLAAMEIGAIDLPQFGYIEAKGKTISIDSNLAKRYEDCFLRPLDIVLIVKGSVGKIGLVPFDVPTPGNGGWVAGQSAIVLRVHPEYCAQSLFVQLRSPMGQALLQSIVSGATIRLIQLRELMKLEIVRSTTEQDAKAKKIIDAEAHLEKEIKEIKREQEELSKGLWNL